MERQKQNPSSTSVPIGQDSTRSPSQTNKHLTQLGSVLAILHHPGDMRPADPGSDRNANGPLGQLFKRAACRCTSLRLCTFRTFAAPLVSTGNLMQATCQCEHKFANQMCNQLSGLAQWTDAPCAHPAPTAHSAIQG